MKNFFIVGCPRSGTTVLQQALNRHSAIVIPPETKFFYYFYGQSRARQVAQLRRINEDLRIELPEPIRRVRTPEEARAVFDEMARRYAARLGRQDVVYFGEKTPEHTGRLRWIREVFPEAKILFLYRDGRDVALSLSRMPWIDCDVYVGMVIWRYYYRFLKPLFGSVPAGVHLVRYEDLAREPAATLAEVLRFLGLPYEAWVAEGWGNREGIPEREYPWKARALGPITAERIGLWRRDLTERQVERLERLGGGALVALGYALSGSGRGRLSPWFLARLGCGVGRCVSRLPLACLGSELRSRVAGPLAGDKLSSGDGRVSAAVGRNWGAGVE